MGDQTILTTESIQEYFKELLTGAMANQQVPLDQLTEYYLVELLSGFIESEKLYATASDGSLDEEPLAFILQRALEGERAQRIQTLRRLGDNSLYVAGFFGDSMARRLVDIDYYIQMGGAAYGTLANLNRDRASGGVFVGLYEELCQKFLPIVDLFAEISERVAVSTNLGVVRLYERWVKTGSDRLTKMLAEQGVIPTLVKPGTIQ